MNELGTSDPRRIGRYRLLGRLGHGGMGTVYLGVDEDGRQAAVKVINPGLAEHDTFRRRFAREAEAAKRVRRFCTAPLIESGYEGDRLYVVTEYVEGPTLLEAIQERGPLSGASLEALAVGVATALIAIHEAGIVHRDLKASNVLLSPVGPRVIDFGIARALDDVGALTGSGELIGTPHYIAPEILGGEPAAPASDVFSWGCLIAMAGTGRTPFERGTLPATINQILHGEPSLDGLEPAIRDLVVPALAKDPAARPTARQLLAALVGDATSPAARPESLGVLDASPGASTAPASEPATIQAPVDASRGPGRAGHDIPPYTPSLGGSPYTLPLDGPPHPAPPEPAAAPVTPDTLPSGARRRPSGRVLAVGAVVAALAVSAAVVLTVRLGGGQPGAGVTATGTPLFQDDFLERRGWDGWTFDPAGGGIRGHDITRGVYTMQAARNYPVNVSLAPTDNLQDAMIGVTAVLRDGSTPDGEFGLLCRHDEDVPNGYMFLLRLDGQVRLFKVSQGARTALGSPGKIAAPEVGRAMKLQAACAGSRLTMWVDGEKVVETTDQQVFTGGQKSGTGLIVETSESADGTIRVEFDDYSVHRPQ
ncbi:protein kinase [Nonomuraea sp. NPDC050663]|uniref:serine/threonine-protein kinase n=1 Tax=Nonomuraea sp. NPDC050663 TaxID=3364370 RepID=UPI0037B98591